MTDEELGINTQDLFNRVSQAIEDAFEHENTSGWGVNWRHIRVADIEYRLSMLMSELSQPFCVVILEQASPNSQLAAYVYEKIKDEFPNTYVECEW